MTSPRHGFIASDLPSPRGWRRSELRTIEAHYPGGGLRACRPLLPHRTDGAIRRCAERLGVRRHNRP